MKNTLVKFLLFSAAIVLPMGFVSCGSDDDDENQEPGQISDNTKAGSGTMNAHAGHFQGKDENWYQLQQVAYTTKGSNSSTNTKIISYKYNTDGTLASITSGIENWDSETFDFSNPNLVAYSTFGMESNMGISYNADGYISKITSEQSFPAYTSDQVFLGNGSVKRTINAYYDSEGHLTTIVSTSEAKSYNNEGVAFTEKDDYMYKLIWENSSLKSVTYNATESSTDPDYSYTETTQETWIADFTGTTYFNPYQQWDGINNLPFEAYSFSTFFFANLFGKAPFVIPSGWLLTRSEDGEVKMENVSILSDCSMSRNDWGLISTSTGGKNTSGSYYVNSVFTYAPLQP